MFSTSVTPGCNTSIWKWTTLLVHFSTPSPDYKKHPCGERSFLMGVSTSAEKKNVQSIPDVSHQNDHKMRKKIKRWHPVCKTLQGHAVPTVSQERRHHNLIMWQQTHNSFPHGLRPLSFSSSSSSSKPLQLDMRSVCLRNLDRLETCKQTL